MPEYCFFKIVFGDAASDEPRDQLAGAVQQRRVEFGVAQQPLEVTAGVGVKMRAAAVERQRSRPDEVGTEADGANKAVFDRDQWGSLASGASGEPGGYARSPHRDCAARPGGGRRERRPRSAAKARSTVGGTEEFADPPALPPGHAEAHCDAAVGGLYPPPFGECRRELLERDRDVAVGIEAACGDEAGSGKDLVNASSKRLLRHASAVIGHTPARVKRIAEAAHVAAGDQREEPGLAAGGVESPGPAR